MDYILSITNVNSVEAQVTHTSITLEVCLSNQYYAYRVGQRRQHTYISIQYQFVIVKFKSVETLCSLEYENREIFSSH